LLCFSLKQDHQKHLILSTQISLVDHEELN
jgi:hypothetical protein